MKEKYDARKRFEVRLYSDIVPEFERKTGQEGLSYNETINALVRLYVAGVVTVEARSVVGKITAAKPRAA